jgi:AsmA protein
LAYIQGTVGASSVEAKLSAENARRADFVPNHPLDVEMECLGNATNLFHSFDKVRCSWPPSGSSDTQVLMLSGSLPDIHDLRSTTLDVSIPGIPADTLVDWLHVVNQRIPADVTMGGTLTGTISHHPSASPAAQSWQGAMFLTGAKLMSAATGASSLVAGNIAIRSVEQPATKANSHVKHAAPPTIASSFVLAATALALGGKEPATLDGHFDATGYTLHLTGMATPSRLLALANALPELGDGLAKTLPANYAATPASIDLTAVRPWKGEQTWTANSTRPAIHHARHGR